jgi:hypothetical protein
MEIQTGIHTVSDDTQAFRLFRYDEGERRFEHNITFEWPFTSTPKILVALNYLDAASYTTVRIEVMAENVNASGFALSYLTWANTQILGVGAQWLAFHETQVSG